MIIKIFILFRPTAMVEKKTAFIHHQATNQVWTHSESTTIHQITNRTIVANEINCSASNDEVFIFLYFCKSTREKSCFNLNLKKNSGKKVYHRFVEYNIIKKYLCT